MTTEMTAFTALHRLRGASQHAHPQVHSLSAHMHALSHLPRTFRHETRQGGKHTGLLFRWEILTVALKKDTATDLD